jgi:predicted RNA-binding Zn-ribbon protein involved in translation (DUF1610 family)
MEALEILRCAACGMPLPLEDGATTRCLNCSKETALPPNYVAALAARRETDALRARAEAALAVHGRSPTRAEQVLVAAFDQPGLIWTLCYGFPVLVGLGLGTDAIGRAIGDTRVVPGVLFIAGFVTLALLPRFVAIRTRRALVDRATLVAPFAIAAPAAPRGPNRCRSCGAPLRVASGALRASCGYCGADNAVSIPDALLEVAGQVRTATEKRFVEALGVFERTAAQNRVAAQRYAWSALLQFAFFAVGFAMTVYAAEHSRRSAWVGYVGTALWLGVVLRALFWKGSAGRKESDAYRGNRGIAVRFAGVFWAGMLLFAILRS